MLVKLLPPSISALCTILKTASSPTCPWLGELAVASALTAPMVHAHLVRATIACEVMGTLIGSQGSVAQAALRRDGSLSAALSADASFAYKAADGNYFKLLTTTLPDLCSKPLPLPAFCTADDAVKSTSLALVR